MAYQKIKTPRFYIDYLSYWKMLGLIDDITMLHDGEFEIDNILDLNPTEVSKFSGVSEENGYTIQITLNKDLSYNDLFPTHTDNGFVGLLGHNISTPDSGDYAVKVAFRNIADDDDTAIGAFSVKEISNPSILNSEVHEYNEHTQISKKGCTLYKAKPNDYSDESLTFNTILLKIKKMDANETTGVIEPVAAHGGNFNINSFCMGHYYDMTNNPDLNVKVTTEFDGFDVTNTLGGSTITNIRYMGAPYWSDYDGNDLEPWAVKKKDPERMKTILFTVSEQIKNLSILLNPIIPNATNKVLDTMNIDINTRKLDIIDNLTSFDHSKNLKDLEILFNKIDNVN